METEAEVSLDEMLVLYGSPIICCMCSFSHGDQLSGLKKQIKYIF